jgi:peptide/nickel transport system permease protein
VSTTSDPTIVVATTGGRRRARPGLAIFASLAVLGVISIFVLFGTQIAPYDPNEPDLSIGLAGPTEGHLLGTDDLGRDVASRVVVAARSVVIGSALVALGAALIGIPLGLAAGYLGGRVDDVTMRWVDVMFALPGVLIVIVVAGLFDGGYWMAVILLAILFSPTDTRVVRAAALEQRALPYVEAARTLGISRLRIMSRHVWPNTLPVVVANTCLNVAFALVALAGLSFLGLGAGPETPDWGRMLFENRSVLYANPAAAIAPGAMIIVTAASLNLVGDWAYERLSDRGRSR